MKPNSTFFEDHMYGVLKFGVDTRLSHRVQVQLKFSLENHINLKLKFPFRDHFNTISNAHLKVKIESQVK
jgi:hypothetical protein